MTSAAIQTYWADNVFSDSSLTAYTDKFHSFIAGDESEKEESLKYYGTKVNFVECVVTKRSSFGMTREQRDEYQVLVRYSREMLPSGANYAEVRNFFEDLFSVVLGLDDTWGGTVDFWNPPEDAPEPTQTDIDGRPSWVAEVIYRGIVSTGH